MNKQATRRNAKTIAQFLEEKKKELFREKKSILQDLADNKGYEIAGLSMEEVGWTVVRDMVGHKIDKIERIDSKIRSIEDALKAIVFGKFGVCQSCEAQIGINRLLAIPEARFCIDCQSEIEQQVHPQKMVA